MSLPHVPTQVRLRPAGPKDAPAIRALIYQVGINPMSLNWKRFVLAVDDQDCLVGCGQIKLHRDGSRELASIAVRPEWRGQGIASLIIHHLLAQAFAEQSQPLYLTCRADLGPFYQRFGFSPVDDAEMPPYFRGISRLVTFFRRLFPVGSGLLVMRYTG